MHTHKYVHIHTHKYVHIHTHREDGVTFLAKYLNSLQSSEQV